MNQCFIAGVMRDEFCFFFETRRLEALDKEVSLFVVEF